jgi:hypothetical protein
MLLYLFDNVALSLKKELKLFDFLKAEVIDPDDVYLSIDVAVGCLS